MNISMRINELYLPLMIGLCALLFNCATPANIADQKADFTLQAASLAQEFSQNETESNQKYVGKVLEIVGSVKGINTNADGTTTLILETNASSAVHCNFPAEMGPSFSDIKAGETTKVKGICSGFLLDVMLDECAIVSL